MTKKKSHNENEDLQIILQRAFYLLNRYKLVEGFVNLQENSGQVLVGSSVQKNLDELQYFIDGLHPADIADILEALPLEDCLIIWNLVKAELDGEVLLETSDAVPETLITDMGSNELLAATEQLDADEIADLAPDFPARSSPMCFGHYPHSRTRATA